MPHLLTLPTELLIHIFAASETIPDALHLSTTSRLLNDVWLEHSESIIQSILGHSIPAYKEAVQLAFLEARLAIETPRDDSPSLRSCLPILLRNADLCASVCLAYSPVCKDATPPPVSYYFLRRVGLGFIHYQLRDDLYLELRAMPGEALESAHRLSHWLDGPCGWEEAVRQGVRENWQRYAADILGDWETTWDYAEYLLGGAIGDIKQGTDKLSIMIEGYDPWDDYPYFEHIVNPKIML
jgi:hypothetical protein